MTWNIQWRERDAYGVKTLHDKSTAEALNEFQDIISKNPTEISVSQPAQTIRGEVPYADIVDGIKRGKVIPFLGAGVPLSSRLPNMTWDESQDFLPSGVELARYLAGRSGMPVWRLQDTDNLARVASYFKVSNQVVTLAQTLEQIFTKGLPTETHKLIASLAKGSNDPTIIEDRKHPLLVITTNYDLLMEEALKEKGVEYDRVMHCGQLEEKCSVLLWKWNCDKPKAVTEKSLREELDLAKRTVLYKMHGSIDTPTRPDDPGPDSFNQDARPKDNQFVITEENYVEFLAKINATPPAVPSLFKEYFESHSFLFLGYSLDDWNLRVILHTLEDVLLRNSVPADQSAADVSPVARLLGIAPQRRHWAIQKDPTEYDLAVWRSRNVKIGNRSLNRFVEEVLDPIQGLRSRNIG